MRFLGALIAMAVSTAATSSYSAPAQNGKAPPAGRVTECRRITSYLAGEASIFHGQPLKPRKLTQLPPGKAYMAVYRRIDGCEAPLTMTEYRNPRRP